MFTNTLVSQAIQQSSGSVMPFSGCDRVSSARVLALPQATLDGTAVCGYAHINDDVTGAFPGIPAWSPPI